MLLGGGTCIDELRLSPGEELLLPSWSSSDVAMNISMVDVVDDSCILTDSAVKYFPKFLYTGTEFASRA